MHEVWAVKVVRDAKATPGVVYCSLRENSISFRGSSFMRCLVVLQDDGWAVLCSWTNKISWTKKSLELEYIYPIFPPSPPFCFPPVLNTPPGSWTLSTARDLHKTTPLISKHTRQPTQLCMFSLGFLPLQLYHNANVSDVDSYSTHRDGTTWQQQRKREG
jgi:hypothetical protein